jgi:hypothetical protein
MPEPGDRPSSRSTDLRRGVQSVLTLVIAVAAIGLAAWEGIENRRHNRLSVQPRLDAAIDAGRDNRGEYVRMAVESTGLGPAVIQAFRIYFDGVVQDADGTLSPSRWQKAIDAFSGEGAQINARAFGGGHYFPTGREYVLFEARRPPAPSEDAEGFSGLLDHLAIQICYCSVYGTHCDEVVLATIRPQVASCAR